MSKSFKVSVVIPCFNHGEFLREAVDSVTGIKRDDIELIVVNDGSTDERTRKEMGRLEALGLNVIRQENKGLAAARNAGIHISNGEYILPLDADNRLRPAYIDRGVQILDANQDVGVVYGDAEFIGLETGRWYVGSFDPDRLLHWNYIDACAIYRRSLWEQNGGYDGTMPIQGYEDWDFWLGALEHSWRFAYVPEVLFDYRRTQGSMISRTGGFESQIEAFIAMKHSLLYRQACARIVDQQASLKWTLRNFRRLLESQLKQMLRRALPPF